MHDLEFASAARPQPYRILGIWMRPYSVGHEILLGVRRNLVLNIHQFSAAPIEYRLNAIQDAVWTCSRSWKENHGPQRFLRFWRWKAMRRMSPAVINAFLEYRSTGSDFPPAPDETAANIAAKKADSEPGRTLGAPMNAALYNFLCRLPRTEIAVWGDSVWDFPYGLACFLYFTQLEIDGARKIENAIERETRETVARMTAEVEAEHALRQKSGDRSQKSE